MDGGGLKETCFGDFLGIRPGQLEVSEIRQAVFLDEETDCTDGRRVT